MSRRVFMTGATGFVGRPLVDRLLRDEGIEDVHCLIRNAADAETFPESDRLRFTVGDVTEANTYADALKSSDTVVHLAAVTGNASQSEHWRINEQGTGRLLAASERASVAHFVFVSSIAAGYPDQKYYHYAQAKAAAEQRVLASPLSATVVRPTIVTGPDAPVTRGLRQLRKGPLLILFGRGDVQVQPIARQDVVELLFATIVRPPQESLIEAGGQDVLSLRQFLELLCAAPNQTLVPIMLPARAIRWLLAVLEPIAGRSLPLTAGQLALFLNDSTAKSQSTPMAVDTMTLEELVAECRS